MKNGKRPFGWMNNVLRLLSALSRSRCLFRFNQTLGLSSTTSTAQFQFWARNFASNRGNSSWILFWSPFRISPAFFGKTFINFRRFEWNLVPGASTLKIWRLPTLSTGKEVIFFIELRFYERFLELRWGWKMFLEFRRIEIWEGGVFLGSHGLIYKVNFWIDWMSLGMRRIRIAQSLRECCRWSFCALVRVFRFLKCRDPPDWNFL